MQVFAAKTAQSFVEAKFRLHSCYSIADYTCAKPDKYQKILPAPVCVNVGRASNIRDWGDREDIPKSWFSFATFSELYDLVHKESSHPGFVLYDIFQIPLFGKVFFPLFNLLTCIYM